MNDNAVTIKAKRAISVFRFLSSIPRDLQRHVFYQILVDSYAQSEFLTHGRALRDLVTAISTHIFNEEEIKKVCELLFPGKLSSKILTVIQAGDFEKLEDESQIRLPEIKDMLQVFAFFRWSGDGVLDLSNVIETVEDLIAEDENKYSHISVEENAFEKLGFLTLMSNTLERLSGQSEKLKPEHKCLFVRWYCSGQILDVVFDTMLNSKVTTIKRMLLNHVEAECWNDSLLCEVVNERGNEFRAFNRMLAPEVTFVTMEKQEDDELVDPLGLPDEETLKALETKKPVAEDSSDTADGFTRLFNELKNEGILKSDETSLNDFKRIFTHPDGINKIKRVRFHMKKEKRAASLLIFFYQLYNIEAYHGRPEFIEKVIERLQILITRKKQEIETKGNKRNIQAYDHDLDQHFRALMPKIINRKYKD